MLKKLSFKEYLETKNQLRRAAIGRTPIHEAAYTVRKYCKLPIVIENQKQPITLKPKHEILVKWLYEDINNPIVVSIRFKNVDQIDFTTNYEAAWSDERLHKWLSKNTRVNDDV